MGTVRTEHIDIDALAIKSEYRRVLLSMTEDVISACNNLEIPYFLTEGSCLGAVRHKGMIPWDDDIDIAIPETYVERFINELPLKLGKTYYIKQQFEGDDSFQIINRNIKIVSEVTKRENPWIDVMVLYGMPNSVIQRELHYLNFYLHQKLYKLSDPENIQIRDRGIIQNTAIEIARKLRIYKLLNKQKRLRSVEKILKKYPYDKCSYVIAYGSWYFKKELMKKCVYGKGKLTEFEYLTVRIPEQYDTYLKKLYGDYMKLPPLERREGKHKIQVIND